MENTLLNFVNLLDKHIPGLLKVKLIVCFFFIAMMTICAFGQPFTPKFQTFQPITIHNSSAQFGNTANSVFRSNPLLPNNSIEQQNRQILQQSIINVPGATSNIRQRQLDELRQELVEERNNELISAKVAWSKSYSNKLQELLQMNPDNFSLTKALYLVESPWYDNPLHFSEFEGTIKLWAKVVAKIIEREGLSIDNNTAINYGIQRIFRQATSVPLRPEKENLPIPTVAYDFNDPMGNRNWSNMLVTKLLQSGKGQCHSMPLLYLAISEQLKGKAWLSLSPNHSFVQYFDAKGNRYNFECTNGNLVTQTWLMQSTFVNATALKKGTYLDTLSSRQLYAQCLADMLLGYLNKIGHDAVVDQITDQILAIDPDNLVALMTQANLYTKIAIKKCEEIGNPPVSQLKKYPTAYDAYNTMQLGYRKVEATGFQEMPADMYQQWLKSIEQARKKEAFKQEQEKMQREINMLKRRQPTLINKPKG